MITVETPGFASLLDFWGIPSAAIAETITLTVDPMPTSAARVNALVCTPGTGRAGLYTLDDGTRVFARVSPLSEIAEDLERVATLRNASGETCSYITWDRTSNVVYVPFIFDEALEGFELERYVRAVGGGTPPTLLRAYYRVKRFLPRGAIRELRSLAARRADHSSRFPAWPLEESLERLRAFLITLLLRLTGSEALPFVWFWPNASDYCLLVTHDVETSSGRDQIERFIALERGLGLRASYNLVPADYEIPESLVRAIHNAGCEVGVHGWTHDGLLFSDWDLFTTRVKAMNEVARAWGATGFRSPATHRNPDWFHAMGFDYDSSAPDTDPFEPQSGGCLSLFPFFVGDVLEIPITMPQDHTLFGLLKERDGAYWDRKAGDIAQRNGLVCLLAHPDAMTGYAGSEQVLPIYAAFLERLTTSGKRVWNPLPKELSAWWRARRAAGLVSRRDEVALEGGLPGMRIGHLRLRSGQLIVEPPLKEPLSRVTGVSRCAD